MINKITIFDLSDATRISYKENFKGYNAWISTVDEDDINKIKRIKNNFLTGNKDFKYFCQFFYDWSDEDSESFIKKNIEHDGPRKSHVQNIISFIKDNLTNSPVVYNLGINCYAGISRSTAIAIIAWVINGKTPEQALHEVLLVRPCAYPNLRILKFASEILNVDIFNPIKKWKEENKTLYTGGF